MATAPLDDEELADLPLPKSKTKLIIIIVIGVFLLAAIGGAVYYFFIKKPEDPAVAQTATVKELKAPLFVQLDSFTVNLLTPPSEDPQFLQVGISLQLLQEKSPEQIKQRLPHIKNQVLMLLTSSKASDISTLEGKEALIGKIVSQINDLYKLGDQNPVVGAFFTSFIIQ
jgi:flagellar FliL protein